MTIRLPWCNTLLKNFLFFPFKSITPISKDIITSFAIPPFLVRFRTAGPSLRTGEIWESHKSYLIIWKLPLFIIILTDLSPIFTIATSSFLRFAEIEVDSPFAHSFPTIIPDVL